MKRDLQHLIREEERTHGVRLNSLRSYVKHALTAGGGTDDVQEKVEAALHQREKDQELKKTEANQLKIMDRLQKVENTVNAHAQIIKQIMTQLQAQPHK